MSKNDTEKRKYFREYMRRRRAGIPQPPRVPREPFFAFWDMRWHMQRAEKRHPKCPDWAYAMFAEVKPLLDAAKNDDALAAAYEIFRRHKAKARTAHRHELKRKREQEEAQRAERHAEYERNRKKCDHCHEFPSDDRIVISDGVSVTICEHCLKLFTAQVYLARRTKNGNGVDYLPRKATEAKKPKALTKGAGK